MADLNPAPPRTKRRWFHPIELAKRLALYAALVYLGLCLYLAAMQTRMIYPGITYSITLERAIDDAKAAGVVPWDRPAPGVAASPGYVRPNFTDPAPRGTIIYFHGNGEFAWMHADIVDAFQKHGFRTFLYEYPGYAGRPGRPSEKVIVPDAQALVRSLDAAGFGPIYVWGQSLGAGVAAAVCGDPTLPVHGLILMTPWDNLPNVGLSIYPFIPVRLIMIDQYDSIANLQKFSHPICVIRSENDELIPPRLTLNLFEHLPDPKKIIVQPGVGHNDWPSSPGLAWWDDALDFIAPK